MLQRPFIATHASAENFEQHWDEDLLAQSSLNSAHSVAFDNRSWCYKKTFNFEFWNS